MDSFENTISDEKLLLKQFQSTLLFQTLLPKLEWFHKKFSWKESFYFHQNSFPVLCEMNIEQENEDDNLFITTIQGKITDPCSSQDIIRRIKLNEAATETASGDIILKYTTHRKNKTLLNANASLLLRHEEELIHQHHITITQG